MKTIAFINMKGGVGKTTLAVNIAHALAEIYAKRVLVVDVDPQFNASTYLMPEDAYLAHIANQDKKTVLDIFLPNIHAMSMVQVRQRKSGTGSVSLRDCVHEVPVANGELHVIPSVLDLMSLQYSDRMTENRLRNFLQQQARGYDYVLVDCPPTISFYLQAAVLACDAYLVPVKPDPLSSIGLPLLERWLDDFTQSTGTTPPCLGVVFCMARGQLTKQMQKTIGEVTQARPEDVFRNTLRNTTNIAESASESMPFLQYASIVNSGNPAVDDLKAITSEFLERARKLP